MNKPSSNPSKPAAGSAHPIGRDPLLEWMKANGEPLSRERYLALAYPEGAPNPLPAELEAGLPRELTRPSSPDEETEADGVRAEALRRSKVRRVLSAPRGQTPD
jgi:hypothetical protein